MILGKNLNDKQKEQALQRVAAFQWAFTGLSRKAFLTYYHINTELGKLIREGLRLIPNKLRRAVKKEIRIMLELGVTDSQGEWRNPIVLVPKPDGSLYLCRDVRKVKQFLNLSPIPRPEWMNS